MIQAENISKSFGEKSVLGSASFSVEAGQMALLTGANGAGKSTLLCILSGLMTPDAGTAQIGGMDVSRRRQQAQARMAYLPQEVRFQETMTPRQVLRFYARLRKVSLERVDPLLAEVDLIAAADQPCGSLSGGMRQRLGLAVTWLPKAPVLLLDEPGLSLDPEWRAYLMATLCRLADEGCTVLIATHLVEVWSEVVDVAFRCTDGGVIVPSEGSAEMPPVATNCSSKLASLS